jgi:hypothetical protein
LVNVLHPWFKSGFEKDQFAYGCERVQRVPCLSCGRAQLAGTWDAVLTCSDQKQAFWQFMALKRADGFRERDRRAELAAREGGVVFKSFISAI